MPTYQYRCNSCGFEYEVFQRMSDPSLTTCTECGKETFERVISAEGGFVLKGSGFYGTDYCGSKSAPKGSESGGGCAGGSCPHAK
ncbi:MAG: zinc ribbon domain-containing protein [Chlorobiaceae bacterium]|nr:zinc ribbon domain-containing protein [Chlorobiaceae bacterium]